MLLLWYYPFPHILCTIPKTSYTLYPHYLYPLALDSSQQGMLTIEPSFTSYFAFRLLKPQLNQLGGLNLVCMLFHNYSNSFQSLKHWNVLQTL